MNIQAQSRNQAVWLPEMHLADNATLIHTFRNRPPRFADTFQKLHARCENQKNLQLLYLLLYIAISLHHRILWDVPTVIQCTSPVPALSGLLPSVFE